MSEKLEEIRRKIDALDHTIHKALMERADLISQVADEKRKNNLPFVQPAREAQMIRRILRRHRGPLPEAAVVRIWRELVGAVSLLQTGLKIAVAVENTNFITWDLAKSYFGSVVQMQRFSAPSIALSSVREGESSFATLPWPQDGESSPWWDSLFDRDKNLRIVCALPYGGYEDELRDIRNKALVVARDEFMDSDDDHSFIILKVEQSVSRGRIVEGLQKLGFEPLSLVTQKCKQDPMASLHLIEVNHFLDQFDERLQKFTEMFEEFGGECRAVGGYPVAPIFKKNDKIRPKEPVLVAPPMPRDDEGENEGGNNLQEKQSG